MLKQEAAKAKKKQKDKGRIKEFIIPGTESYRKNRENLTRYQPVNQLVLVLNFYRLDFLDVVI